MPSSGRTADAEPRLLQPSRLVSPPHWPSFQLLTLAPYAIDRDFQRLRATEVTPRFQRDLRDVEPAWPADADARLRAVPGMANGGVVTALTPVSVQSFVGSGDRGRSSVVADAYALSQGAMDLLLDNPPPRVGGTGAGCSSRRPRWILFARQLGIDDDHRVNVFVDGISFSVVGIVEEAPRHPELLEGVVIPQSIAREIWSVDDSESEIVIETVPGWAAHVGAVLPTTLDPGHPDWVAVTVEPEPRRLADAVTANTRSLVLSVAGIALLAGLLAISNSVSSSVIERTPELALRRVFGARPSHLQRHVLTESVLVGLVSGCLGLALGWCATMLIVAYRHWVPVVDVPLWMVAPLLGALCGVVAGAVPAWRASRIEPAEGVRRE